MELYGTLRNFRLKHPRFVGGQQWTHPRKGVCPLLISLSRRITRRLVAWGRVGRVAGVFPGPVVCLNRPPEHRQPGLRPGAVGTGRWA